MRNYIYFLSTILTLSLLFPLASCKDDEPPPKAKISFTEETLVVNEDDGVIEIEVTLDKPAEENTNIEYELDGSADTDGDYEIVEDISDFGEIDILKGEKTGIIEIQLISDGELEDDETIEISITDVNSDRAEISLADDSMEITVEQEDGLLIVLEWPAPTVNATADMDLLLHVGPNTTTWDFVLLGSADGSFAGPEFIFIPKVVQYPAYGLSYTYYEGNINPLTFKVTFIDFASGALEAVSSRQVFEATYTLANLNPWAPNANNTKVVQTFEKVGGSFTAPSFPIAVPTSGSRTISSGNINSPNFKKGSQSSRSLFKLKL